jgi:hypothetical protein
MLFTIEELARAQAHYLERQEQPRPKAKAEILAEICREDPTCTVAELATAAERSKSWVRRTLKQAGIVLAKPVRRKKAEVQP